MGNTITEGNGIIWGTRLQLTVDDTGLINIPANSQRKYIRMSNMDTEDAWFAFGNQTPVAEVDIALLKDITLILSVAETGVDTILLITPNATTTTVTYQ